MTMNHAKTGTRTGHNNANYGVLLDGKAMWNRGVLRQGDSSETVIASRPWLDWFRKASTWSDGTSRDSR